MKMSEWKVKELMEALMILEVEGEGLFDEEIRSAHRKLKEQYEARP